MQLRVFTEPQNGASYSDQLRVARAAEAAGFDAFFRSDHFLTMAATCEPGPTDSWATLAALARETQTIRLGTLVSSMTFRLPGVLAITAAQVDDMSGGRLELGIGSGWYEAEHSAYGIPFPPLRERFDRLEESVEIIAGLWRTPPGQTFDYDGRYYKLQDSPALPKPVQTPHPPLIVGGYGKTRTPRLAARYANEFNLAFADLATTRQQFERVRAACGEAGRSPDDLVYSAAQVLCVGRDDAEVRRRADAIGRSLDSLAGSGAAGTVDQVVDKLGQFAENGARRIYIQMLDLSDLDHLELVASQVVPQLAS